MSSSSDITATDLYCGAGGSTTGLKAAGIRVTHAANHWDRAIDTHNTNHPEINHSCVDLHIEHPHNFPTTTIGWFSIECRVHSPAGGRKRKGQSQLHLWEPKKPLKPEDERSRMGAWDVVRFAEFHRYQAVIVENVVEFLDWELCDVWLQAMHKLGYRHQVSYLNSQFAYPNPAPQSRDRIYIVFHRKGNRKPNLDFRSPGRCPVHGVVNCVQAWKNPCKRVGKYGKKNQYLYVCPQCAIEIVPYQRPARDAIDWSLVSTKVKDRKEKPLCPATLRRIERGLKRFAAPHLIHTGHWGEERVYDLNQPTPTVTTKREFPLAISPFIAPGRTDNMPTGIDEPTLTWTASNQQWLVQSPAFIDTARSHNVASGLDEPTPTVTTGRNLSIIQPPSFLAAYHSRRDAAQSIDEPSPTVATCKQFGLVQPEPFISSYYGKGGESLVGSPAPTIRTVQGHCLIEPDWSAMVQECGYRMIVAKEAKLLMGFLSNYVILGSQGEQFKQIGNAVTPCTAEMIGRAVMESLS